MLFDTVLAFDHVKHRILIIANARVTADEDLTRALPVRVRQDPVPRARARAQPVAAEPAAGNGAAEFRSNQTREQFEAGVRTIKEQIAAGDIYQAVLSQRFEADITADPFTVYRALRHVNPSPYMYFIRLGGLVDRRLVAGDAGPRRRTPRRDPSDRRHAAARRERGRGPAAGRGAEAQREGARRARDARRSRPQRSRPGLRVRHRARAAVHGARALLARHAPGLDGRRHAGRGSRPSRRAGRVFPGRHGLRRAEDPRHADSRRSSSRRAATSTPARSATSTSPAISISASRSAPSRSATASPASRPAPGSSPTRTPPRNSRKPATRRARCCRRSPWRRKGL